MQQEFCLNFSLLDFAIKIEINHLQRRNCNFSCKIYCMCVSSFVFEICRISMKVSEYDRYGMRNARFKNIPHDLKSNSYISGNNSEV